MKNSIKIILCFITLWFNESYARCDLYTVQENDHYLSQIAKKFTVSPKDLYYWNDHLKSQDLETGRQICISEPDDSETDNTINELNYNTNQLRAKIAALRSKIVFINEDNDAYVEDNKLLKQKNNHFQNMIYQLKTEIKQLADKQTIPLEKAKQSQQPVIHFDDSMSVDESQLLDIYRKIKLIIIAAKENPKSLLLYKEYIAFVALMLFWLFIRLIRKSSSKERREPTLDLENAQAAYNRDIQRYKASNRTLMKDKDDLNQTIKAYKLENEQLMKDNQELNQTIKADSNENHHTNENDDTLKQQADQILILTADLNQIQKKSADKKIQIEILEQQQAFLKQHAMQAVDILKTELGNPDTLNINTIAEHLEQLLSEQDRQQKQADNEHYRPKLLTQWQETKAALNDLNLADIQTDLNILEQLFIQPLKTKANIDEADLSRLSQTMAKLESIMILHHWLTLPLSAQFINQLGRLLNLTKLILLLSDYELHQYPFNLPQAKLSDFKTLFKRIESLCPQHATADLISDNIADLLVLWNALPINDKPQRLQKLFQLAQPLNCPSTNQLQMTRANRQRIHEMTFLSVKASDTGAEYKTTAVLCY